MNLTYSPAVLAPDNYSYREREWRAPILTLDRESQTIVFDEPGRVLNRKDVNQESGGVCYRAYYFRVIKPEFGQYMLLVKHGGGTESWQLTYTKQVIEALGMLDSDSRYLMLHTIMRAHQESRERTAERINASWQKAAAQKRIKTRKLPGQNAVKVWIEPEVVNTPQTNSLAVAV